MNWLLFSITDVLAAIIGIIASDEVTAPTLT